VALTVVPMAAAILLRGEAPKPAPWMHAVTDFYGSVVAFTLRHRGYFFVSIVLMLWGSWVLFGTISRTFSPRTMERQVSINVDTPRRYSLEQTEALFDEVMGMLNANRERLSITDISSRYSLGGGRSRSAMGGGGKRIEIYLAEEEDATLSVREIRDDIRELLPVKAGVDFRIDQSRGRGGGGNFGVQVQLAGDDMQVLELIAENVMGELAKVPWVRDLDTSLESGDEEIYVEVNRERALQAGLSSQAVATTINNALSSRPVSRIKTPEREVELVMQYREEDRQTLDQLKNVPVFGSDASLPISALADFRTVAGPRAITREDRQPRLTISANTSTEGTSVQMTNQLQEIMDGMSLPPGYEWTFGRSARFAQQDMSGAYFALLFAALLIYLIMAALFESFVQPFTIMFSIPFAFIGVGVVLRLTNQPLDTMSNLGLIILMGVVVNNAIVLIHHINDLRDQGMNREDAIVSGGRHRFRPIIMTALTTMLGLLPMVAPLFFPGLLGTAEGRAGNWAPVGLVILAGMTTSTFLTLIIVPTIYSLVDDAAGFFRRIVRTA
jgi:HAE1 family hydrophobic/amphiphilic exporter-1